jgi:hypothetical protein
MIGEKFILSLIASDNHIMYLLDPERILRGIMKIQTEDPEIWNRLIWNKHMYLLWYMKPIC